jgi:signal transduction histidine kinase
LRKETNSLTTEPARSGKTPFKHPASLYWRLSATLLLILAVLAVVYVYVTAFTADMYFQEATQRLNAMVAPYIAREIHPLVDGRIDRGALKRMFDAAMVLNPSVEVYLLDSLGGVIAYSAPDSVIRRRTVGLAPVKAFLRDGGKSFVMGDDPRSEKGQKAFSAAAIGDDHALRGYLYVILGGKEYDSVTRFLLGSYILRLGVRGILLTLIGAAVIGLIAFRLITRSLGKTISTVKRFQNGDLSARVSPGSSLEVRELGEAFNEMADTIVAHIEEIRTMDNLRRDLVANVSHDLRTPLVSIHGYVETILMKESTLMPGEREKYLRTVLQGTERLKKLVEELFELSKLEAKQTKPVTEEFSLAELVQDVVREHQIMADEHRVRLSTDFSRDLPFVRADIALIERVFQNLLDNAIRFTPEGGTVTITLAPEGKSVGVNIADTGEGIGAEDLPYIFDRYRRGPQRAGQGNSGAGLGLAIVKKILELHGVTITVSSRVREGTTFSFRLPADHNA